MNGEESFMRTAEDGDWGGYLCNYSDLIQASSSFKFCVSPIGGGSFNITDSKGFERSPCLR